MESGANPSRDQEPRDIVKAWHVVSAVVRLSNNNMRWVQLVCTSAQTRMLYAINSMNKLNGSEF